jgi:iron-sulfur cluster insertion protein
LEWWDRGASGAPAAALTVPIGGRVAARRGRSDNERNAQAQGALMNDMTEMPAPLVFTDNAAEKVKSLIEEEGNPELKLRVFVTGGGCSGFQYGFTFDEVVNDDDTSMQKNGVTLLIDPMSYQYLIGAEIDYTEGLEGAQFVIKNPNAQTTCGCGSSFSV